MTGTGRATVRTPPRAQRAPTNIPRYVFGTFRSVVSRGDEDGDVDGDEDGDDDDDGDGDDDGDEDGDV